MTRKPFSTNEVPAGYVGPVALVGVTGYGFEASPPVFLTPALLSALSKFGFCPYGSSAAPFAFGGVAGVPVVPVSRNLIVTAPPELNAGDGCAIVLISAHAPAGERRRYTL